MQKFMSNNESYADMLRRSTFSPSRISFLKSRLYSTRSRYLSILRKKVVSLGIWYDWFKGPKNENHSETQKQLNELEDKIKYLDQMEEHQIAGHRRQMQFQEDMLRRLEKRWSEKWDVDEDVEDNLNENYENATTVLHKLFEMPSHPEYIYAIHVLNDFIEENMPATIVKLT